MTVEAITYISDLNPLYPDAGDTLPEGDDHIRNIKTALKATFPGVSGAVLPTHTELNFVDGVTSAIQTQIDTKALVLISTATFSLAAAVDLTTGIDSTYSHYEIHLDHVYPDGASDAAFYLRYSINGGSSFAATTSYPYAASTVNSAGTATPVGSSAGSYIALCVNTKKGAADGGLSGVVRLVNPAGASYKHLTYLLFNKNNNHEMIAGAGAFETATAVNAIRIAPTTGTCAGSVRLYGVKKS